MVVFQEEWPSEVVETSGPEAILSVVNINKARFLGSFRVVVSHQVLLPLETTPVVLHILHICGRSSPHTSGQFSSQLGFKYERQSRAHC